MPTFKSKPFLDEIHRMGNPQGSRLERVRLDKNERTTPFPEKVLKDVLSSLSPSFFCVYPETQVLIEKIAAFHRLSPTQVTLTAGSDAAIKLAFESFVSPGDEIVIAMPTFAMVSVYAALFEAKVHAATEKEDLSLDLDAVLSLISKRSKLIYLANPNSPGGRAVGEEKLSLLLRVARENDTVVLVDEAYFPFSEKTAEPLLSEYENLILTRTFSKAWGLAGLRIGYALSSPKVCTLLSKWRPMYEANALGVVFALKLLEEPETMEAYVAQVRDAKARLYAWGNEKGFFIYPSDANFVNVRVGATAIAGISKSLEKRGILVRGAGSTKVLRECLRISLGTWEQIEPVLQEIERVANPPSPHPGVFA